MAFAGCSNGLYGTDRTSFLIGSIGKTDTVEEIYDAIGEYVADLSQIDVTVVSKDKYQTCIAVVCLSEYEKSVENGLHALGFVRISGSFSGIAADEKKRLKRRKSCHRKRKTKIWQGRLQRWRSIAVK